MAPNPGQENFHKQWKHAVIKSEIGKANAAEVKGW